jgi:hypothetical protein
MKTKKKPFDGHGFKQTAMTYEMFQILKKHPADAGRTFLHRLLIERVLKSKRYTKNEKYEMLTVGPWTALKNIRKKGLAYNTSNLIHKDGAGQNHTDNWKSKYNLGKKV